MSENSERFTTVVDGEQVVRMLSQGGEIIPEEAKDPSKYFTALVNTPSGPQLAVKTYLMGISNGGSLALIRIVSELPETGVSGTLYGVLMQEMTRDNYGIIQFFVWYENEWYAVGAYSIEIEPNGLVYEQSFDASTNTWNVTVNKES